MRDHENHARHVHAVYETFTQMVRAVIHVLSRLEHGTMKREVGYSHEVSWHVLYGPGLDGFPLSSTPLSARILSSVYALRAVCNTESAC